MKEAKDPEKRKFDRRHDRAVPTKIHTVKEGETLSAIAKRHYGDPKDYTLIYEANKDEIGPDPDKIKPGMKLMIPHKK